MGKDGDMIKTAIPSKWHSVVRQMVKENPSFEILVERK
jgi:NADH:ubiquinone oxidoreductase subunit